jgi:tetratricopeptide (TPR) repeat protein
VSGDEKSSTSPRAVIIPFGVPPEGKGLGLGLAALVHGSSRIDGGSIALAQLLSKKPADSESPDFAKPPSPVETFLMPLAWKNLAERGDAPPDVSLVITGTLEPPVGGSGLLQLLAFDAKDGHTRARVDVHLDEGQAGTSLLEAFDELWRKMGGEPGLPRELGGLGWEALESVLLAERCNLHDAARGGPHDRLAAMMHLSRAVEEAPDSRFAAGRLAAVAIEAAASAKSDPSIIAAALRTLTRATHDAPAQIDLLEACAAIQVRLGHAADAEGHARAALEIDPKRGRLYALLSEACRSRGDNAGAIEALDRGSDVAPDDVVLMTERGVVLSTLGEMARAKELWRKVVAQDPIFPSAYANLAAAAMREPFEVEAQLLIDRVLATRTSHPDVVRQAIALALAKEAQSIARAARIAKLARTLLERVPNDAWCLLILAQALVQSGDHAEALVRFRTAEMLAAGTALGAQAQRDRFALENPERALEVDAVLRAAIRSNSRDLPGIVTRARRLAEHHGTWTAWLAVGVAERRTQNWDRARAACDRALAIAPGCTLAHVELVAIAAAEGDSETSLRHAERVRDLEGETARALGALAAAYSAAGRLVEARVTAEKALAMDPSDAAAILIVAKVREQMAPKPTLAEKVKRFFSRS